jgi:hypothetical protein
MQRCQNEDERGDHQSGGEKPEHRVDVIHDAVARESFREPKES